MLTYKKCKRTVNILKINFFLNMPSIPLYKREWQLGENTVRICFIKHVVLGMKISRRKSAIENSDILRQLIELPLPFVQRYGWHIQKKINFEYVDRALALFVGEHDFKAFCKEEIGKPTVRTLLRCNRSFCSQTGAHMFTFEGKSFLRHMIRRLIGAAVEAGIRGEPVLQEIQYALTQKKSARPLPCAPAKGLCLEKILYQEKENS